jgi:hypothetical protein
LLIDSQIGCLDGNAKGIDCLVLAVVLPVDQNAAQTVLARWFDQAIDRFMLFKRIKMILLERTLHASSWDCPTKTPVACPSWHYQRRANDRMNTFEYKIWSSLLSSPDVAP